MKKFFKGFGVFFFTLGAITYIYMAFSLDSGIRLFLLVLALFCIYLDYLLLRKKKPKIPKETTPLTQAEKKYMMSALEVQDELRLVDDSSVILATTKNLDTFFSRYKFGLEKAHKLSNAEDKKIAQTTENIETKFKEAYVSQLPRLLDESYWEQSSKIEKYKTEKTKLKHWQEYLEKLEKHETDFAPAAEQYYQQISVVKFEIDQLTVKPDNKALVFPLYNESSKPFYINEEEEHFFKEFQLLLPKTKQKKITLARKGDGTINVYYGNKCPVGRINLQTEKGSMQLLIDLYDSDVVYGSAEELEKKLPVWVNYIKKTLVEDD